MIDKIIISNFRTNDFDFVIKNHIFTVCYMNRYWGLIFAKIPLWVMKCREVYLVAKRRKIPNQRKGESKKKENSQLKEGEKAKKKEEERKSPIKDRNKNRRNMQKSLWTKWGRIGSACGHREGDSKEVWGNTSCSKNTWRSFMLQKRGKRVDLC